MDETDKALEVAILASMVKADKEQAADQLEMLATMLENALPERTTLKRAGWFMSKARPVAELSVQFDEAGFLIVHSKHGSISAKEQKIVRGISLKSTDISMEVCIERIASELGKLAEKNSATRESLRKFVEGR